MMDPVTQDYEIMTVKQVADWIHLKPGTIRRWAGNGILPGFKIGKDWRFYKSDVVAKTRELQTRPVNLQLPPLGKFNSPSDEAQWAALRARLAARNRRKRD